MLDLHVRALVDLACGAVGHEPRRPELRERVGEHELDRLALHEGLTADDPLLRERGRLRHQPVHGAAAPRSDHEAFVPEPLVGEVHAVALVADPVRRRHADVLERENRVVVVDRVRVLGHAHDPDARRVDVHDEHRVLAGVRAFGELRLEEDVLGVVEGRHVPLDAVQYVVVADATRRRQNRIDVGASPFLGDRVALALLAADRREDPPLHLEVGRDLREPGGRRVDQPRERVRRAADLLLHQDLLQRRETAAAELLGHVDGLEAGLVDHLLRLGSFSPQSIRVSQVGERPRMMFPFQFEHGL